MLDYTKEQESLVQAIVVSTEKTRRKITMYKAYDSGLAMFRIIAMNHISDLYIAKVTNQPYPREAITWVKYWDDGSDLSNSIQSLFNQIKSFEVK